MDPTTPTTQHEDLLNELNAHLEAQRAGGGEKALARQKSMGKLPVRERLELLLDPATPFLEVAPLAGLDLYEGVPPGAGLITGIGTLNGRPVMVIANDPSVKGGTYFPITVKKHLRAQTIALENHLPCIYLVDSGGAFLPMQDEVFPDRDHFGRIFFNQSKLSQLSIPQISVVLGSCTAGGAYIPAMSDETIIVKGKGTIFLGGPPLVKASTGEEVTSEELGGGDVHCRISGVADHLATNEVEALTLVRKLAESFPSPASNNSPYQPSDPERNEASFYDDIPVDHRKAFDMRKLLAHLVDQESLQEFKELYGPTLVTAFARIWGYPVGILANNGILFSESALKGSHFIQLCESRGIPLLFLQNITGFMVGKEYEHGGIAKDGAKMVHAVSGATVPKLTVIVGGSFGAGNYGMCGRAYDPRFLWMWPQARISVMGGEQAAGVLTTVKQEQAERRGEEFTSKMEEEIRAPILEKYEEEGSPYYSTARLWDDGILEPHRTRDTLGLALSVVHAAPRPDGRFGVFRM